MIRAPAERNVSHVGRETDSCFAPLERGESSAVARSINISLRWSESQLTAALESWPSAMAHDF
ncbi:MAG: hypothetical protein QOF62_3903 [Pyrinomonadaceae bacterium]|jgi:hypothetical protein|nr:hypothetical protein [Pyrinomonadaceae bacterium]